MLNLLISCCILIHYQLIEAILPPVIFLLGESINMSYICFILCYIKCFYFYFLSGFGGTRLYAIVDDIAYIPSACELDNVPIGTPFSIAYNVTIMHTDSDCDSTLLSLTFNNTTKSFEPLPGIHIITQNFGRFSNISPIYYSFPRTLQENGYTEGINLYGAPYDYRYSSISGLESIGFFQELSDIIEKAYKINRNKGCVLLVTQTVRYEWTNWTKKGPFIYVFLSSVYLCHQVGQLCTSFYLTNLNNGKINTSSPWSGYQEISSAKWTPWNHFSTLLSSRLKRCSPRGRRLLPTCHGEASYLCKVPPSSRPSATPP